MAALLVALCSVGVFASDTVEVYVTIVDANGQLALTQTPVTVTDVDGDGVLSVYDALYAAHESGYEGGAAAGFAAASTEYGLSLTKLWGTENGGSYGYYVNQASAWSLADPVKDGDFLDAFVYTDLTTWSDTYCFFDVQTIDVGVKDTLTLTLLAAGYDAEYNPITVPVSGAYIVIGGEKTEFQTDADGKVTISLADAGDYTISAVSDTQTLVPPVCTVTVEETAVATGDGMLPLLAVSLAMLACGGALMGKKRIHHHA